MYLCFTRDHSNCLGLVKIREKNNGEEKFDYHEKTVEINKVLIIALKLVGFLGAMTTMTITLLINLIMKTKESKLSYYGQVVLSQSRFLLVYFLL